MARLFLRAYVRLLLALLLGALLLWQIVGPALNARLRTNIEQDFSPPIAFLAEMLADQYAEAQAFPEDTLARARARLEVPVAIVAKAALPPLDPDVSKRLERGEVVGAWTVRVTGTLYARIGETGYVLAVGPLNVVHPAAGGRGPAVMAVLLTALVLGMYLALLPIQRRLARLATVAEGFGTGQLGLRANAGPPDAIGDLITSFNRMANELERLIGAHKQLLRTVSHELRTPLQRLHFAGELVRASPEPEDRELGLERMERDLLELDQLIEELLTFARLGEVPEPTPPVDLRPILDELVESLGDASRVALVVRPGTSKALPVRVPSRLQRRALGNLLSNAMRHASSRVEVEATLGSGSICVDVEDDGPGVLEVERERIFEPFHRVDDEVGAGGFGLGLAIVRGIAECHGGTVWVTRSAALGGARFRLELPLCPPQ